MAIYNEKHEEIPDNTPVEMPLGYEKPESLESMIARMVQDVSRRAKEKGTVETFEEADDFDDNEPELKSPYQMTDMEEEQPRELSKWTPKPTQKAQAKPETVPPVQPMEKAQETNVSAQTQTVKT